jgi:hypothetical protein
LAANAAAWFAYSDPSFALEIAEKVLALDSFNRGASNLIKFRRDPPQALSWMSILNLKGFVHQKHV